MNDAIELLKAAKTESRHNCVCCAKKNEYINEYLALLEEKQRTFRSAREVLKTYLPKHLASQEQTCEHCNDGYLIEKETGIIAKALIPCPHCEEGKERGAKRTSRKAKPQRGL